MDDYYSYDNINPEPAPAQPKNPQPANGMATAALVLGICSLVFFCCGGFLLGALGIILALLSRGTGRMSTTAKTGFGLSIAALVIGIIAYTAYFSWIFTSGTFQRTLEEYQPYYFNSEDTYEYDDDFWNPGTDNYRAPVINEKTL